MGSSWPPARWVVSGHSCVTRGWETVEEHEEEQGSPCVHAALAGNVGLVLSHVYFPEADVNCNTRHSKILFVETSLSKTALSQTWSLLKYNVLWQYFNVSCESPPCRFSYNCIAPYLNRSKFNFLQLANTKASSISAWLFFKTNKNKHVLKPVLQQLSSCNCQGRYEKIRENN